ncbi:aminomethyl-transferring glycine dehydrogenase subunit GcvPA [Candidatus Protochlamydia phocaeensis]|uniref:aminomethyl-transferring glycine dehydrogenase subunit GcvPA n=1 Tax=Candidatus Protochlamydia phocaeensis TaxID=1414722 RepID=UPI000838E6D9|nr:aminomethyl-transferring glycine dehydrogenase subunit GcvPA [Candidatus Protochlamydia phocaeensis]
MDFISNQEPQIQEMLKAIGISCIDELFRAIPSSLILKKPFVEDGLSEYEGIRLMERLAAQNTFPSFENYLGAGAYEHHVPAIVGAICSKSEFLTAYTPYQAEASQGMLQIIFEFQSAICALTGMDVANASVYDGASACAEALLMALRQQKTRRKVLVAESVHPHYRGVIEQYLKNQEGEIALVPFYPGGKLDSEAVKKALDEQTAAILIQSPNFLGNIEEAKQVFAMAKEKGALSILCADPLSYGLYASAAELGADIAVGDCQPLGLSLSYGGPYAGYMACRQELMRQMPGRIVGETVDRQGKRGFVLTLQAREQHIRREKATSNICTNQALAALASLIAILWYGKEGLPALALTNYQRANYLKQQLTEVKGATIWNRGQTFNEFVIEFSQPLDQVLAHFRKKGIEPGLPLGRYFPSLSHGLLVAVTETKSQDQLNRYVQAAKELNDL